MIEWPNDSCYSVAIFLRIIAIISLRAVHSLTSETDRHILYSIMWVIIIKKRRFCGVLFHATVHHFLELVYFGFVVNLCSQIFSFFLVSFSCVVFYSSSRDFLFFFHYCGTSLSMPSMISDVNGDSLGLSLVCL